MLHFFAGGAGGVLGAIVTCPLEVVKTRLQSTTYLSSYGTGSRSSTVIPRSLSTTHSTMLLSVSTNLSKHLNSTFEIMRSIYKSEGYLALWKGLGPTLLGVGPSRAMSFGTYSWAKDHLSQFARNPKDNTWIHITSASCAGIVSATITNPLWMIKTRLQLQSDLKLSTGHYKTSFQCLTALIRNEGLMSLYRGLSASYLGIAETVIQFVLYEKMKLWRGEREIQRIIIEQSLDYDAASRYLEIKGRSFSDWTSYLIMAAGAKLTAAMLTYPHEVCNNELENLGRGLEARIMRKRNQWEGDDRQFQSNIQRFS